MADAAAATETTHKSIVNAKYRDKYKGEKDWLAKLIERDATKFKDVSVVKVEGDEKVTTTEKRADGVDVDALFTLADKNGLDVSKYHAQAGNHGFPGRFRMTIRNMLQKVAKQRHGVVNVGGTFETAPADFREKIGAPAEPTHTQAGEKIAKPKAEKAADAPAAETGEKKGGKGKGKPAADANDA